MHPKLALGLGVLFLLVVSNAVVGWKAYNVGLDVKQAQWDKAELKRKNDEAAADDKIINQKPKVKHENQNRGRVDLVKHVCARGWVLKPEQCTPYR